MLAARQTLHLCAPPVQLPALTPAPPVSTRHSAPLPRGRWRPGPHAPGGPPPCATAAGSRPAGPADGAWRMYLGVPVSLGFLLRGASLVFLAWKYCQWLQPCRPCLQVLQHMHWPCIQHHPAHSRPPFPAPSQSHLQALQGLQQQLPPGQGLRRALPVVRLRARGAGTPGSCGAGAGVWRCGKAAGGSIPDPLQHLQAWQLCTG